MNKPLLHTRSHPNRFRRFALFAATALALAVSLAAGRAVAATSVIIFGDSLSDVGNIAHRTNDKFGISYPGGNFNYSDHRFTNSSDTDPGSGLYAGVWHEQLSRSFLGLRPVTDSLDGGTDYAFGGATTVDGTTDRVVYTLPDGSDVTITIDNMGKQVDDYIAKGKFDATGLYIVWGGGNDILNDPSATSVTTAANNIGNLVTRLAKAGARSFLVPNVPPLGDIPEKNGNATDKATYNAASSSYRDQLNSVLDATFASLSSQGITVTITRLDVYTLFQNLLANPTADGFTNVTDSSQGADVNVNQYLFWDGIHPTTAGHNQISQAAADILPGGHPPFFNGEALLSGDYAYLNFPNGQEFGYYSYQFYPYLYHTTLGFEYVINAIDSNNGAYLYDFKLATFLYTSPTLYPYLYNFKEGGFYYYFVGSTAPRVFFDFKTQQYVYSN